jgi:cellulose synthase/poly-beta-1,6-N-acetylglucosamine synthase-like glycosyltransferase
MQLAAIVASALSVGLAIAYLILGSIVARRIAQAHLTKRDDADLPPVAIILALRGGDHRLAECLRRILHQDHPNYTLTIVVDSTEDPAWRFVRQVLPEKPAGLPVRVETLKNPSATCGRKCSALLQGLEAVDYDREIIALFDGDVVTHRTCLRSLVSPFHDSRVGVTHGNQWYPPGDGWGMLCRYLLYVYAVAMMPHLRVPWAGCFAIRKELLDRIGIAQIWGRVLSDEQAIRTPILRAGFQIRFVPSLVIFNTSQCTIRSLVGYFTRQLLWGRLYVPIAWVICNFATVFSLAILVSYVTIGTIAAVCHDWITIVWCCASLGLVATALATTTWLVDSAVRKQARLRGESIAPYKWTLPFRVVLGLLPAFFLYSFVIVAVWSKTTVVWRGVVYRVRSPFNVQVVEVRPILPDPEPESTLPA